jgi:hypothetical protein
MDRIKKQKLEERGWVVGDAATFLQLNETEERQTSAATLDASGRTEAELPTVLRSGPYRFFFYSADGREPPHVHVERDGRIAKFWLNPIRLQTSGGFSSVEVKRVNAIVTSNVGTLLRCWNEFFAD